MPSDIMQVDKDSLRSSFVKAGVASRIFDKPAMVTVSRLACTLQGFMDERAAALVRSAGRRAVLHHYQNDATSYLTRYELRVNRQSEASLRRRQKETSEFLVERSFYITLGAGGEPAATAVVCMPRSLSTGTTAWHCYNCSTHAHRLLKEMGHQGISIAHYCYDRAKFSAIFSLQQARHNMWASEHRQAGGHPMQPHDGLGGRHRLRPA